MVMNHFFYKIFISLLISSSLLYLETNSQTQSNCPDISANLTNGVTAVLIKAPDGELLGIRVTWTIRSEYLDCQFTTLRVELYISGPVAEVGKDISGSNRTADFSNDHLDCNEEYTPRVRAVHDSSGLFITQITDNGIPVVYRSDKMASPSQLPRVCVGPPTSPEVQTQGKLNISWDPLPCHLQNGDNIRDYIIRCTQLTGGEPKLIYTSTDSKVECHQEPGSPYSCLAASSFFVPHVTYIFQVAAQNTFGTGSFNTPVLITYSPQHTNCSRTSTDVDQDLTSATQSTMFELMTSLSVVQDPNDAGLIAAVISVVIVLLGAIIVLVVIVLLIKKRKQHRLKQHEYEMVSNLHNKKPKSTIETAVPKPPESKTSLLALKSTIEDIHDRSENEKDTPNKVSMKNVLYEPASEPKITDFQPEIHATAGEQVTLRVNFTGIPKPTITWTFKGTKMEGDYATELGTDGSLLFVCVETKHTGRYVFEVSNGLGSIQGCTALVVHEGEGEDGMNLAQSFESNPVTQQEFGEYVASLHSCNNSTFILQYESLMSGEEGHEVIEGRSEVNRPLNRFRNITAYDDHRISLVPLHNFPECQNDYINASYIDGFSQANKYIASQGPLPITVMDFWRLMWQEK